MAVKSFASRRLRYEACEIDTKGTFNKLKFKLLSKGCDDEFVEEITSFAERCRLIYKSTTVRTFPHRVAELPSSRAPELRQTQRFRALS